MLNNAADNWLDQFFESWQVELFDGVTLSYEAGYVKPDPRIYKIMSDRLGVGYSEMLFVDDQQHYCDAAEQLGIHSICYTDFNQFKADLYGKLF